MVDQQRRQEEEARRESVRREVRWKEIQALLFAFVIFGYGGALVVWRLLVGLFRR